MRFLLILFLLACHSNGIYNIHKDCIWKYYRVGKSVEISDTLVHYIDNKSYCVVKYCSGICLDSSFYKNGKLYGYSKKKLGDSISIGFYMDGKKNGWFDLFKNDSLLISKYYLDDTLYQKNEYYRNGKFKFTFHIPCIEMSLSTKDQSYFSDSTFDLTASDEGDSILVFIIKGISRNYSYRYVLKYSERDTIYPINKNNLPYFTYKLPKNTKRQYEILSAVVKQDSLIYKKIDFSFTTPLPKNCFIK